MLEIIFLELSKKTRHRTLGQSSLRREPTLKFSGMRSGCGGNRVPPHKKTPSFLAGKRVLKSFCNRAQPSLAGVDHFACHTFFLVWAYFLRGKTNMCFSPTQSCKKGVFCPRKFSRKKDRNPVKETLKKCVSEPRRFLIFGFGLN